MTDRNALRKIIERKYLDEIQEIYRDFPQGEILDCEPPDFLVKTQSKTVGIELTTYIRKQLNRKINDKEIEKIGNKIVNIAQEIFQSRNNINLQVSPLWKIENKLTHKQIDRLASALVDIVEKNIPVGIHDSLTIRNIDLWNTPLGNFCSFISIVKLRDQSLWISHEAGFTSIRQNEIRELIYKKVERFANYIVKCDEIWLIIICESNHISSMADLQDVNNWKFESPFDAILIYDRDESVVHRVFNNKSNL